MKIVIGRFPNGSLKVIKEHEDCSYFWKESLTECLVIENLKKELESTIMVSWWNKEHHQEFEHLWNMLVNGNHRELEKDRSKDY